MVSCNLQICVCTCGFSLQVSVYLTKCKPPQPLEGREKGLVSAVMRAFLVIWTCNLGCNITGCSYRNISAMQKTVLSDAIFAM